jgi:hypothetical protein
LYIDGDEKIKGYYFFDYGTEKLIYDISRNKNNLLLGITSAVTDSLYIKRDNLYNDDPVICQHNYYFENDDCIKGYLLSDKENTGIAKFVSFAYNLTSSDVLSISTGFTINFYVRLRQETASAIDLISINNGGLKLQMVSSSDSENYIYAFKIILNTVQILESVNKAKNKTDWISITIRHTISDKKIDLWVENYYNSLTYISASTITVTNLSLSIFIIYFFRFVFY